LEVKRIFTVRFCLLLLLLVGLNCGLFYKEQTDHDKVYQEEEQYSYIAYSRAYEEALERLQKVEYEQWNRELSRIYQENKGDSEESKALARAVNKTIASQMEYRNNYDAAIDGLSSQAEKMIQMEIYQDPQSYGYHNLLKTRYDLKKLSGIPIEVSSNIAFDRFFSYGLSGYFLAAMVLMTAAAFIIQEEGFRTVIHTTRRGRLFLNLQRLGIILTIGILYSVVLYSLQFLIAFEMYGGIGDIQDLVQSNPLCQYAPLVITKAEYLCLFVVLQGIGAAVVGLVFWSLISVIRQKSLSILLFAVLLTAEYLLFINVRNNALSVFLKNVNLFTYISSHSFLGSYENWGMGTYIISRLKLVVCSLIAGGLLFSLFCVLYNTKKKAFVDTVKLPEWLRKVQYKFCAAAAGLPNFIKECNKILVMQKGYVIILFLLFYLYNRNFGVTGTLSETQIEVTRFYDAVSGDAYAASDQYVEEMEEWIEGAQRKKKEFEEQGDQISVRLLNDELLLKKAALKEINEQIAKVRALNEAGHHAGIVNQYMTGRRYGMRMCSYIDEYMLVNVAVVILLLFQTFSVERSNHMERIIRTARRGRMGYLRNRTGASLLICFVCSLMINLMQLFYVNRIFPVAQYEKQYAIQSVEGYEQFPIPVSIEQFDGLLFYYRVLMILMIGIVVLAISMLFDAAKAFVAAGSLLVLPHLLYAVGFDLFKRTSLIRQISFFPIYMEYQNSFGEYWGTAVIVALCVLSLGVLHKKWNI